MKRKWTKWVFGPCLIVGFCFGVRPASRRAAALAWGRLASTSEASKSMENGGSKLSRQQAGATQSGFAMAGPRSTALRAATSGLNPAAQARIVANYGTLPLSFEANHGQTDPQVKFLSRGSGYTLFLTGSEAVLDLRGPTQRANGKRQVANVAQRSPLNLAALPSLLGPKPPRTRLDEIAGGGRCRAWRPPVAGSQWRNGQRTTANGRSCPDAPRWGKSER